MTKAQKFQSLISSTQIAPPENLEAILKCISQNKSITFLNWKMFSIKKLSNNFVANPNFDTYEADKYIQKEIKFIKILTDLKIKFNYVKLIPDELPKIFFDKNFTKEASVFSNKIGKYFKRIYPQTNIIRIEELLNNPIPNSLYKNVFIKSQTEKIDPDKLKKEIKFRSTHYTNLNQPLSKEESQKLAKKAFGLFAAETAVIFQAFENPVLIAGARSVDTYKYEFCKYPKNRPVLPKLFVL